MVNGNGGQVGNKYHSENTAINDELTSFPKCASLDSIVYSDNNVAKFTQS